MFKEKILSQLAFLIPKAPPLLGVDISASAIKIVELASAGKDGYRLERYVIEALPKDTVVEGNIANLEAAGESLQRAWRRLGSRVKNVAMALPASAVITKKVIIPATAREEDMEVQIESEANQYLPFALDEVNLDFQVLGQAPTGPEEVEVLIAASRKEKVEDRVAIAESAGLKGQTRQSYYHAHWHRSAVRRADIPASRPQSNARASAGSSCYAGTSDLR